MKNYHITFALAICVALMTFIIGCGDYYGEGDETAKQRFEKFTSQEKTLYNAVQSEWGQKRLLYIREAVGRREARPGENTLPFQDIANVIKSNNSATLKLDNSWPASTKNKYIKARWDRVDEKWYRELLLSMGVTDIVKQDLIPEPIEEVISDSPTDSEPDTYGDRPWVAPQEEKVVINIKDLIPQDKYDDLYYEIKNCPEAVQQYKLFIKERLLTWQDYETLTRISIKCKAATIGEKFEL